MLLLCSAVWHDLDLLWESIVFSRRGHLVWSLVQYRTCSIGRSNRHRMLFTIQWHWYMAQIYIFIFQYFHIYLNKFASVENKPQDLGISCSFGPLFGSKDQLNCRNTLAKGVFTTVKFFEIENSYSYTWCCVLSLIFVLE